jgi:hypothetical protein
MEPDKPQLEADVPRGTNRRRWPAPVVGLLLVAVLAVGAWQVVELHRQVTDLQRANDRQRTQIASQQSQLSGLNAALNGTAGEATTAAALGRIQNQIGALGVQVSQDQQGQGNTQSQIAALGDQVSQVQGNTRDLSSTIDCVYQAVKEATVNSDGSLFIAVNC